MTSNFIPKYANTSFHDIATENLTKAMADCRNIPDYSCVYGTTWGQCICESSYSYYAVGADQVVFFLNLQTDGKTGIIQKWYDYNGTNVLTNDMDNVAIPLRNLTRWANADLDDAVEVEIVQDAKICPIIRDQDFFGGNECYNP